MVAIVHANNFMQGVWPLKTNFYCLFLEITIPIYLILSVFEQLLFLQLIMSIRLPQERLRTKWFVTPALRGGLKFEH